MNSGPIFEVTSNDVPNDSLMSLMNVRINWHKLASYVRSNSEHGCHGPRNRTGSCSKPGIPWDATEKQIRNDFGEGECGEIEAPETQPEQRGRCAHM